MATTTEFDVAAVQTEHDEASAKLADLNAQMLDGSIEPNGETKAEVARLAAEVSDKGAQLREKRQEADFDSAREEAESLASDRGAMQRDEARTEYVLANMLKQAMTGEINLRIAPPVTVDSDDSFHMRHLEPREEFIGNKKAVVLQSEITAPEQLRKRLFEVPATRKAGMDDINRAAQTKFTTLTTSGDAPIGVDFYNKVLIQPQWGGNLYDSNVVSAFDVPHTQNWDVPSFGIDPTIQLPAEGSDLTRSDVTFQEANFGAFEVAVATDFSKKFNLASQDPAIISGFWETMQRALVRKLNQYLTTGTGSSQPHGIYTAAQEAFQTTNTKGYRGVDNANFLGTGNTRNNLNRYQSSAAGTTAANKRSRTMLALTEAMGLLNDEYIDNPKFGVQAHRQWAHSLLFNEDGPDFSPNMFYPWVDFTGASQKGVIYRHLNNYPVYSNLHLAKAGGADTKLAVVGDFSRFWVRRSPIDMFTSEHVDAEKRGIYLQLCTYVDSNVVTWSQDVSAPGPFVFIEGIA